MRQIVFDTETTGFDPAGGDRLVEIGCVEVVNLMPTGKVYHQYINPERDMPEGAEKIHGLSAAFLKDYPVFSQVYAEFIDFVGDATLVAHNAEFDMKFINAELKKVGASIYPMSQSLDTLALARRKFPGSPNTLDALCKRYAVDNSSRVKHGALLDAELLAEVYLELMGGRQRGLLLAEDKKKQGPATNSSEKTFRPARTHHASAEELGHHEAFVDGLTNPLWRRK